MKFQAAKWIKVAALLEAHELAALLEALRGVTLFPLSGFVKESEVPLVLQKFVAAYSEAFATWGEGQAMRPYNATAWTRNLDAIELQRIDDSRSLVRLSAPCVQVQLHHMTYSAADGEFRPMVFGSDAIFWGLQWSFPQVYQDPKTQEFIEKPVGPNAELFHEIRRWMREHTLPTPMCVGEQRVNLPMRIGRNAFASVQEHPHLKARGLRVEERAHVA